MDLILRPAQRLRLGRVAVVALALAGASSVGANMPDAADHSIKQFLAQGLKQHPYRAVRHLEAQNGSRKGWMDAITEYSPSTGFRYDVIAEGGSDYIRSKVLKPVLDGEREVMVQGEIARSLLTPSNYAFQANGIDADGFANVLLSPRRKEPALVSGMMALTPTDGALVRLQGRLAKSPSVWLKNVDIVRTYARLNGSVVPVALESKAQVRLFGEATLRMTYVYSEIDGRRVGATR